MIERQRTFGEKIKTPAKVMLGGLALIAAIRGGEAFSDAMQPEFSGDQIVHVTPGDTIDGLINEKVDGGASHTGEVRVKVLSNPENDETFANDQLDPGEDVHLPESVK